MPAAKSGCSRIATVIVGTQRMSSARWVWKWTTRRRSPWTRAGAARGSVALGSEMAQLLADGVAPDKLDPMDMDRAFRKLNEIKPRRSFVLKIEGSYTFNAPRDRVWQVLLDPKVMAQCMPGCEALNEVGPDQYEATMKVGVAAVKGTYKGKVAIKDKQAPAHYVLSGEGSGGPGFMQGDVAIDLAATMAWKDSVVAAIGPTGAVLLAEEPGPHIGAER